MRTEYSPKYWNETAEDYKLYQKLTDMLVPSVGDADTENGNLLLAISTFGYDQYNNGHCNFTQRKSRYNEMLNILSINSVTLTTNAKQCVKAIENVIELSEQLTEASDEIEDQYEDCSDCHGSGVIDEGTDEEYECPTCGGSGEVEDIYATSEYDDLEGVLSNALDNFSSYDSNMEDLDELISCIISYIAEDEGLNEEPTIEEEAILNGSDVVETQSKQEIAYSQELLNYLKEIRITEEEFAKAQLLCVNS